MPNVSHSTLSGSELHEPKGITGASNNETYVANGASSGTWKEPEPKGASGASSNQTYVSDGAGSGTWTEPEPKGISSSTSDEVYVSNGSGSGAWKTIYTQGFEDFNDAGATQNLTSGVWIDLQNDGAGSFTNTTYRLPGKSAIWDTVNDEFDWSGAGLALGDTVDIRFDITATTSSTNDTIALRMDMAHGDAGAYSLEVMRREFDVAGTYQMTALYSVYMGDTTTLNNPCKVACFTNAASNSVVVNGWYIRTIPRNPVLS